MAKKTLEQLKEEFSSNPDRLVVFGYQARDEKGRFLKNTRHRYLGRFKELFYSRISVEVITPLTTDGSPLEKNPKTGRAVITSGQVIDSYPAGHFFSPRRFEE